jgi:CubicO group peptidase (beta-lactamase class C family)
MDLLGMTAGLSYPGDDPAGQYAAKVFEEAHAAINAGSGIPTVEFMNRLGEQPLAFAPGTHWRYSTCADVLGAVVEVVSGKRFGEFLRDELFIPLNMVDTAFFVPEEKRHRFVTCYEHTADGLAPWLGMNLACGVYDRDPAFESGGAGLVSTLEDYSHFADMMMNGGVWQGKRILSPASVKFLTTPQLSDDVRRDMWDSLNGYSYGRLCRVCVEPDRVAGLAVKDEYGWDGWLGSYYCNFPNEGITLLSMQNTTNAGTSAVVRRVRNALLAALSRGEI